MGMNWEVIATEWMEQHFLSLNQREQEKIDASINCLSTLAPIYPFLTDLVLSEQSTKK